MRRVLVTLVALMAAACSGGDQADIAYGEVVAGEVTETVAAPATIQPRERSTVTSPATGVVEELLVTDGDEVTAGELIVRIGAPTLAQQIEQAEAAVAAAGALRGVSTTTDLSPLLDLAADNLETTVASLLDALEQQASQIEDDEQRQQAQQAISDARDQNRDTVSRLRRAADDARASAEQADAAQRAAAEAQRAQAQAALDGLQAQQGRLEIVAPIDGVVELARGDGDAAGLGSDLGRLGELGSLAGGVGSTSSAPVAEGAEVGPGQPLLTIFDLSDFHAAARVDEVDAVDVAVGQTALVLVDALPETELRGRVERVSLEPAEGATGVAYDVTVSLLGATDLPLRVGLTASVEIDVITVDSDTVVPTSALLRRGGQEVVFVRRDGRAVEVPVTVEAIGLDDAAVTGELSTGDEIVVRGVENLADGDELP